MQQDSQLSLNLKFSYLVAIVQRVNDGAIPEEGGLIAGLSGFDRRLELDAVSYYPRDCSGPEELVIDGDVLAVRDENGQIDIPEAGIFVGPKTSTDFRLALL